jgi:hypothetical protein
VILADASARVEYDRATGSAVHLRMRELIVADGPLACTDPVRTTAIGGRPAAWSSVMGIRSRIRRTLPRKRPIYG